jgi:bifunctional DNase/RNase
MTSTSRTGLVALTVLGLAIALGPATGLAGEGKQKGPKDKAPAQPPDEVTAVVYKNLPSFTGGFTVILKDVGSDTYMPIYIGTAEGIAIQRGLDRERPVRPMTHNLLDDVIGRLGGTVDHLTISDLIDGTYYGTLHIKQGKKAHEIDCRPSDGMALATTAGAPIRIAAKVLKLAGMDAAQMQAEGFPVDAPAPSPTF